MSACVILYRTEVGVFAELDVDAGGTGPGLHEFANRDEAIAYADDTFGPTGPYQIVELDEL